MRFHTFISVLVWVVTSAANDVQHVIADSDSDVTVSAGITVPFLLPIPGTLEKASGNVTVTASSNGTLGIHTVTQLFDRKPSIFSRSWNYRPRNLAASKGHRCTLLGHKTATEEGGVSVPIAIPIPGSLSLATGNSTIGVQWDGRVYITTYLQATLENGDFRSSIANDSIGIGFGDRGVQRTCEYGKVCMMPEAEIDIQEEEIDVTINGVNGNTAIDIFF